MLESDLVTGQLGGYHLKKGVIKILLIISFPHHSVISKYDEIVLQSLSVPLILFNCVK